MKILSGAIAAVVALTAPCAARAAGIALEANGARAEGEWGGELGAGYSFGALGLSIRPMAGAFLAGGEVDLYGRLEAVYEIPLVAEIGVGARFSEDDPRPYATVATPILPAMRLKANVGPHYYALGFSLGF